MSTGRSWLGQYENAIGGIGGGVLSALVCHPMDLLRIRFSANEGSAIRPRYNGYMDAARKIVRAEGARGLYQGLSPSVLGAAVSWGAYFQLYNWLLPRFPHMSVGSGTIESFLCAYAAGAGVMCVTNPIWLAKTRLCLQYGTTKRYSGMADCLQKIAREEGIRGLYKGFVAGVVGACHGGLQMMVYSYIKDRRSEQLGLGKDAKLPTTDYLMASVVSKVVATTGTFPHIVVRTRMQDHNAEFRGVWRTITRTVQGEGIQGLYKGLLMTNIRTLPASVITFVTYEEVRHLIRRFS